jgi:spoIIIJ-associated protein
VVGMREVERSAGSVEEAVEAALEELGVSEQEAQIEIVQEPERGFLGMGSQAAVVRVRVREEETSAADLEEQAALAVEFLEGLLDRMGVDADVEPHLVDGVMYVDLLGGEESKGMGLLIGRHGQTLESIHEIVRTAVQRRTGERCLVVVDVEDYRKRRRSQLAERAGEAARRVRRTGKQESLEPMNPYERKIVHDAASQVGGVETSSEGEDPRRRVVIRKKRG